MKLSFETDKSDEGWGLALVWEPRTLLLLIGRRGIEVSW